jgi:carbon storage regulator
MLVLSRKIGQAVIISDSVEITILEIKGETVRLGIAAPRSVSVLRKEVRDQVREENLRAAATAVEVDAILEAIGGNPNEPGEAVPPKPKD